MQDTMTNQNPAAADAGETKLDAEPAGGFYLVIERYLSEAQALRYWLAGLIAIALLVGLLVTLLSTELFKANSRIEVSQITSNVTAIDPLENESKVSEIQYLNTQYELLESNFMATRVARAGNLQRDEEFIRAFALDPEVRLTPRDVEEILLDNVSIEPIRQSSLVDIQFSSPSASVAAKVANLWAEEFIAANYEKRFGANIEAREFLNKQIEELRQKLSTSERDLVQYANAKGILVLESGGKEKGPETAAQTLIASDLTALNDALAKAVTDRITAEASQASGDIPAQDARNSLRAELAKLEAEVARLRSNFGPAYPPVLEKEAEVASLKASLATASRASLSAASSRERELRRKLEEAKSRFLGQQELSIQYGILKREVDTNRQLYDALLQRYKELEASGAGQNNITLIDKAEVPLFPYAPSLLINLLLAGAIGVALSIALVYLRVTLSQTIKDPQDVSRRLGLPVLGLIPRNTSPDLRAEIVTRSSEISEAYKSTRTNLTFLTPQGAPKVLMLTSSVPSEGKSVSTIALATSFVHLGKRTLLIDADLRNSRMQGFLEVDLSKSGGLSGLLTGNATSLSDEVVRIDDFGFDYLTFGYTPPNPVELLASNRFKELLEEVKANYDQILIDSAPMLALADAVELARVVDGVVYVIESDRIKVRAIENALNRLTRTGARVYGAIVTKLDSNSVGYGYGYGYKYGETPKEDTQTA